MAFIRTCRDIRLDQSMAQGKCILRAECQRRDGSWQTTTIDLYKVLSFRDGQFHYDGVWVGFNSWNCTLDGSVFSAQLKDDRGHNRPRRSTQVIASSNDSLKAEQRQAHSATSKCVRKYNILKAEITRNINKEVELARLCTKHASAQIALLRDVAESLGTELPQKLLRQLRPQLDKTFDEAFAKQEIVLQTLATSSQQLVEFQHLLLEPTKRRVRQVECSINEEIERATISHTKDAQHLKRLEVLLKFEVEDREKSQQQINKRINWSYLDSLKAWTEESTTVLEWHVQACTHRIDCHRASILDLDETLELERLMLEDIRNQESKAQALLADLDEFQQQLEAMRQELYRQKTDVTAQLLNLSAAQELGFAKAQLSKTVKTAVVVLEAAMAGTWQRSLRYKAIAA